MKTDANTGLWLWLVLVAVKRFLTPFWNGRNHLHWRKSMLCKRKSIKIKAAQNSTEEKQSNEVDTQSRSCMWSQVVWVLGDNAERHHSEVISWSTVRRGLFCRREEAESLVFNFVCVFQFEFVFNLYLSFILYLSLSLSVSSSLEGVAFLREERGQAGRGGGPEQIDAINCKSEPKWNHFCRQNLRHCQFELLGPKHMRLWYKFQIRFDSQSENVNFEWWRSANFQLEGFNKSHFGKLQFTVGVFAGTF